MHGVQVPFQTWWSIEGHDQIGYTERRLEKNATESREGHKYFFTVVEQYSCYVNVCMIEPKDTPQTSFYNP